MNMVLLGPEEIGALLPRSDERIRHIAKILKKGKGDEVVAGLSDGRIGLALVERMDEGGAVLSFRATGEAAPLRNLTILLGIPRPIQATRILKDLASLGARRVLLCPTELGEASYAQGSFYAERGWERAIREGAAQAANPRLPEIKILPSLAAGFAAIGADPGVRIALDPDEKAPRLSSMDLCASRGAVLAVGSERGWTGAERSALSSAGFEAASLGERILRTETATIVAAGLCLAAMGEL